MTLSEGKSSHLNCMDRFPSIRSAGKLIPPGDRAQTCLQEISRPPTPSVLKKFLKTNQPAPGCVGVLSGKADDPDIPQNLVHGIRSNVSSDAGGVVNPPQQTRFQDQLLQLREAGYASRRTAPLGRSHDQSAGLPEWFGEGTTFGVKFVSTETAGQTLNPPITAEQVQTEALKGHTACVCGHNDFSLDEPRDRKSDPTVPRRVSRPGGATPQSSDGWQMARCLRWPSDEHRIAETPNIPPDRTFGVLIPPDTFGAAELIYCGEAGRYPRGPDHQLGAVSAAPRVTSSSLVQATAAERCPSGGGGRTYGVPSVRSDLQAPHLRRMGDTTNYGEQAGAGPLLHPSLLSLRGVHAEHLFCPRSREEMAGIFRNVGVNLSAATFDAAWELACDRWPDRQVCVHGFREVLREMKVM